jgi:hypothetical protein
MRYFFRTLILAITAILLCNTVFLENAFARQNISETASGKFDSGQLYERCKADLYAADFNKTECGVYLTGFKESLGIAVIFMLAAHSESETEKDKNDTLTSINEILAKNGCTKKEISHREAAKQYIQYIDKDPNNLTARKEPAIFFWAFYIGCGNPHLLLDGMTK